MSNCDQVPQCALCLGASRTIVHVFDDPTLTEPGVSEVQCHACGRTAIRTIVASHAWHVATPDHGEDIRIIHELPEAS